MAPRLLLLAIALAFAFLGACSKPIDPNAPLTPEAKAYTRNLKLSDISMQGSDSFAGGRLVEILGKIQNAGDRNVRQIDITCIFYDPYNQIVTRQRLPIVKTGLKPGEEKSFRLPFDTLPESWNQALPQVVIAGIAFE